MSEGFSARVGRIISGSVNALIDALENAAPEVVMEQVVREVDATIEEIRTELGRVAANKHLASTRLMEENRRNDELSEQTAVAVTEGRDDLAEAAIAQQLDIEAQIPVLERTIAECAEREQELRGYINALQGRRREMREELARYADARRQAQTATPAAAETLESRLARAESAFDRILERSTGMPGRRGSPDTATAARLAELEDLNRRHRIQERLAALKATRKD